MNINRRIKAVVKEQYPDIDGNHVWVQARVPKELKAKAEAKMLSIKASGKKINWQVLVIALLQEFSQ